MEIIKTILITLAALAALTLALVLLYRQCKQRPEDESAANIEEWGKIKQWLQGSLFSLVTIAEQTFGDKTGQLKFSAVLSDVVAMLPDKWRGRVSVEVLTEYIEDALSAAKLKWLKNPALIGKEDSPDEYTAEDGDE